MGLGPEGYGGIVWDSSISQETHSLSWEDSRLFWCLHPILECSQLSANILYMYIHHSPMIFPAFNGSNPQRMIYHVFFHFSYSHHIPIIFPWYSHHISMNVPCYSPVLSEKRLIPRSDSSSFFSKSSRPRHWSERRQTSCFGRVTLKGFKGALGISRLNMEMNKNQEKLWAFPSKMIYKCWYT